MSKNLKKSVSTFVGINQGNMCSKFQKIRIKTEGGDRFEELAHSGPFPGPGAKLTNIRLVLLSGLIQGTCVPNFKRFEPKLKEEIGF